MGLIKKNVIVGKRYNINGEYRYVAQGDKSYIDETLVSQCCRCKSCKTKLVSWDKEATCPKCAKNVYLT